MGVGYPEDLVVCVALGADMFDCVWPTRTAVRLDAVTALLVGGYAKFYMQRFGNAITSTGTLNLRQSAYAEDFTPIEDGCLCTCCKPLEDGGLGITRAYIYHVAAKETAGAHLYVLQSFRNLGLRRFLTSWQTNNA